ncbi:MAG TPA: hypothetical protein VE954_14885 [Oligoflexus sp.]|uniref:hypothetical protein n=1 Tax=Oligoflexus sp. TaxID=1971216 RepID=UPI002D2A2A9A|nr:hypothetical protein [Oligoflexus sp.]HYX34387.1 hypothetical protein [Oligoflexus sp.]
MWTRPSKINISHWSVSTPAWVGWSGSYGFASRTEIFAVMNDIPGVYGDNGGSLSVCLE